MATTKQTRAARRNISKAQQAATSKRSRPSWLTWKPPVT